MTSLRLLLVIGAVLGTIVSAQNLFVSSGNNNEVLEYNGATGAFIGVFVPPNSGGLTTPVALRFSPWDRNLHVASLGSNQVLKFNGNTGAVLGSFATVPSAEYLRFGPD